MRRPADARQPGPRLPGGPGPARGAAAATTTAAMLGLWLAGACGRAPGMDAPPPPRWAMAGATPERSGRSAYLGPGPGPVLHTVVELPGVDPRWLYRDVSVHAVGADGTIHALAGRSLVHALDPEGSVAWTHPIAPMGHLGGLALTPFNELIYEGREALGSPPPLGDGVLTALDMLGAVSWRWRPEQAYALLPDGYTNAPTYDPQGNVYVILQVDPVQLHTRTRYLHAFTPSGALRWRWSRALGMTFPPALGRQDAIYISAESLRPDDIAEGDGLTALHLDGRERWRIPATEYAFSHVAVAPDGSLRALALEVGSHRRVVLAIDPDGAILAAHPLPPDLTPATSLGVAADGTTLLGLRADGCDRGTPGGELRAVTPEGTLAWAVSTAGCPYGGLAVDGSSALYVVTDGGNTGTTSRLRGFEADGAPRLDLDIGARIALVPGDCDEAPTPSFQSSSVVISGPGRLLVGSDTGQLHLVTDAEPRSP